MLYFRLLSAALILSAASGQSVSGPVRDGQQWLRTVVATVPDTARGQIRIIAPGSVVVQGTSGSQISYILQIRADSPVGTFGGLVQWQRRGPAMALVVNGPAETRYELQVKVPRGFGPVRVEAPGGGISVFDLDGPLEVRAGGGRLQLDRIAGAVDAESWGGEVRLGQIGGTLRVRAGAGAIQLERGKGETWLETGGGDIMVRRVDGPLHAATGAGNIQASQVGGIAEVRTAGGRIEIGEAAGVVVAENEGGLISVGQVPGVECRSASGAIRLREASAVRAATAMGSITADLPAGRPWHGGALQSGQGDIIVFIPSKLSVTVVARSSAASRSKSKVVSDFPGLQLQRRTQAATVRTVGQLSLNGGGPVLEIEAVNGAIYLRRQQ